MCQEIEEIVEEGPRRYLSSFWNIIDSLIIMCCIAAFTMDCFGRYLTPSEIINLQIPSNVKGWYGAPNYIAQVYASTCKLY